MKGKIEVSVASPMVVSKSKSWHWYPSIRKMNDGSLILVFSIMADAEPEDIVTPHQVMVRSTDGGSSWYFHRYLYFPVTGAGHARVIAPLSNGTVLELPNYVHAVTEEEFRASYWKSNDNGVTFSGPLEARIILPKGVIETRPAMARTLAEACFYRSIIELENGDLLASMYGSFKGDRKSRSWVVKSTDRGESWAYLSTIAYDPNVGTEGFDEPVMALLPDGDLLCVMRTGSGEPLYQARSSDGGKTWNEPEAMEAKGVDPDLIVLSDGTLACSYGRHQPHQEIDPSASLYSGLPYSSMGDSIMFSTDGGVTWTGHTTVYTGASTGYTGIEEVPPNKVLYTFDTLGYGWSPYNTVRVATIKVGKK